MICQLRARLVSSLRKLGDGRAKPIVCRPGAGSSSSSLYHEGDSRPRKRPSQRLRRISELIEYRHDSWIRGRRASISSWACTQPGAARLLLSRGWLSDRLGVMDHGSFCRRACRRQRRSGTARSPTVIARRLDRATSWWIADDRYAGSGDLPLCRRATPAAAARSQRRRATAIGGARSCLSPFIAGIVAEHEHSGSAALTLGATVAPGHSRSVTRRRLRALPVRGAERVWFGGPCGGRPATGRSATALNVSSTSQATPSRSVILVCQQSAPMPVLASTRSVADAPAGDRARRPARDRDSRLSKSGSNRRDYVRSASNSPARRRHRQTGSARRSAPSGCDPRPRRR